jgi:hypothetical protein
MVGDKREFAYIAIAVVFETIHRITAGNEREDLT